MGSIKMAISDVLCNDLPKIIFTERVLVRACKNLTRIIVVKYVARSFLHNLVKACKIFPVCTSPNNLT